MTPKRRDEEFDTIVVGSGAGGGMAAHALTHRGLRVLLLEAGRHYDPLRETPMFATEADAPLRNAPTPDKPNGYFDATVNGGWEVPGEPYTVAIGSQFKWWRARMLGGRTNHWGRASFRFGPYDFKDRRVHSMGVDWPIDYEEIAPYYDRVERLIGVFGAAEGIENSPDSPPGVLQPPPPMRAGELFAKMVMENRMGIPVVPNHAAILTRPLNGRAACVYATPCGRGCALRANFQTPTVLLPPALATGRLTVRTSAMVYEVVMSAAGLARGVRYIDKNTGVHREVRGRSVVVAASACESARLLLNSRTAAFPNGVANSSGQVGRNLLDTVGVSVLGQIPSLEGLPIGNEDGVSVDHVYAPWWGFQQQRAGHLAFSTGYHVEITAGRQMPALYDALVNDEREVPVYGRSLREEIRRRYGSTVVLAARGAMIPNRDTFCELDPAVKDRWDIPVLRFHWKWGEQEFALAAHAHKTFEQIIVAMGGRLQRPVPGAPRDMISVGGGTNHEVGTTRMGATARDSVVNRHSQTWDVPNLYVADGGVFSGNPDKNPTLTILALAWRASDHLAEQLRRREWRT